MSALSVTPSLNTVAIAVDPEAFAKKTDALKASGLVGAVLNPMDQEVAVEAMKRLKTLSNGTEEARKALKKPFLDAGKAIDDAASSFSAELEAEYSRLQKLVSDFQAAERRKQIEAMECERRAIEAENRRRAEEQECLEREQREKIAAQQLAHQENPFMSPPPAPAEPVVLAPMTITPQVVREIPKAKGTMGRTETKITVTDIHAIYKAHPELVNLTINLALAKQLVKAGMLTECPGLEIAEELVVSVRG